nr:APC family permease [Rhodococcus sp. (in: high G+C Gram-positive bacteria)]
MTQTDGIAGDNRTSNDVTSSGNLRGDMSSIQLLFTVLAYNAPVVVVFTFIPVAILIGNGLGAPVAFLACGIIIAALAYGIVAVGSSLDKPGGFYSIVTAGLGRVVGLATGFTGLIAYFMAAFATYGVVGLAINRMVTEVFHGPDIRWWVWAMVAAVIVGALGYFNINLSAKVMVVFLACEIALVVVYDLSVLFQGGAEGLSLHSFSTENIFSGSLAIALLYGMSLYGGFEATVIFRDEVRDPKKTIPRATYGMVLFIAVVYSVSAWLFINSYGAEVIMDVLAEGTIAAGESSVNTYLGSFGGQVLIVLLCTSSFALVLAAHNITSRYIFNFAADGIFPRKLGQAHSDHVSPHRASLLVSALCLAALVVLAIKDADSSVYANFLGVYSYAFAMMLTVVSLAAFAYLWRRGAKRPAISALITFPFLVILLVLTTQQFELFSGATGTGRIILIVAVWGIAVLGAITALAARKWRPEIYARIGRQ